MSTEAIDKKYSDLKKLLENQNQVEVDRFIAYCRSSEIEINKTKNELKNPHFKKLSAEKLKELFLRVKQQGLSIDGKHIIIGRDGISYDYIAYKNKMLLHFPESIIDTQIVYKDDEFTDVENRNGKYQYSHKINNIFSREENDIIGCYIFIKNKRGEFFTTLTKIEIEKHKKVARTQAIWNEWYKEMIFKTIIKKGCKSFFEDIYSDILEDDNKENDLSLLSSVNIGKVNNRQELLEIWQNMSEQEQILNKKEFDAKVEELNQK